MDGSPQRPCNSDSLAPKCQKLDRLPVRPIRPGLLATAMFDFLKSIVRGSVPAIFYRSSVEANIEALCHQVAVPQSQGGYQPKSHRLGSFSFEGVCGVHIIQAWLVFVYFVGDEDVNGPRTIAEWKAAIRVAKGVLGLGNRNKLSKYVVEVFVDVRDLD